MTDKILSDKIIKEIYQAIDDATEDNPELPKDFVKEVILAEQEIKEGNFTPYKSRSKTTQVFLSAIRKMHSYGYFAKEALNALNPVDQQTFLSLLNEIDNRMPLTICEPIEYLHLINYALDKGMYIKVSWKGTGWSGDDTNFLNDYNKIIDNVEKHHECNIYVAKHIPSVTGVSPYVAMGWFTLSPYDRNVTTTVPSINGASDFAEKWSTTYRALLNE